MSIIDAAWDLQRHPELRPLARRIAFAAIAIAVVAGGLTMLAWLVFASGFVPKAAPRNPFGLTLREVAPNTSWLGGLITAIQAQFYGALTAAVQAMKASDAAITSLASIGFLYGIFHAAGPGHGKGVISGYILASKRSLWRGLTLSLAAALLQATVAVAIVTILALVLNTTTATINAAARTVEIVSFAGIAGLGILLVWWKAGQLELCVAAAPGENRNVPDSHDLPSPAELSRIKYWREYIGVVIAAGIRPCTGALLLLVFSLSQGLYSAGIVGAYAMALGTAITTGTLAALAVFAKAMMLRVVGRSGNKAAVVVGTIELLAAAFVLALGAALLTGVWAGGLPSALD